MTWAVRLDYQAVHRATARELERKYPGRFVYRTRGIDFLDTKTGNLVELTTQRQVASHMARPGYQNAEYAIYALP